MSAQSLTIDGVSISYGADKVLDEISLTVAPGEFVALLGASGCGKTTLLRAISGFVPVTQGKIMAGTKDITGFPPEKRNMTMVFQSYALWPHMSVGQNIAYGLKLRRWKTDAIRLKTEAVLKMLHLSGLEDRPVVKLSGGQRQRVALGRALAVDPEVLLLDEPLSNLDARIREDVRHEIKHLQSNLGITTIHVTHDREEAMVMADRIVVLDKGKIAQVGTPEQIYNRPNSPFMATFLGAGNCLPFVATGSENDLHVRDEAWLADVDIPLSCLTGDRPQIGEPVSLLAYFRSMAAAIADVPHEGEQGLILKGRILQSSYPGGYYRYTVLVGDRQFLVDDSHRYSVGDQVSIFVSFSALHLFRDTNLRQRHN